MRHRRKTVKLQRNASHRKALLSNLTCSLIEHGRIKTTLAKAKGLRPIAERMITLGKRGNADPDGSGVHTRRQAHAFLRDKSMVKKLFEEVAPASADRMGGYTRITRLPQRNSDAAEMAYIEWVDISVAPVAAKPEAKEAEESKGE